MQTVTVIPRNIPFAATRPVLAALDPDGHAGQLPFIWHLVPDAAEETGELKSQLRYRNATRALVDARGYAARLAARAGHLTVNLRGPVHESDVTLLGLLRDRGVLTLLLHGTSGSEEPQQVADEETAAADADAEWVRENLVGSSDWTQLRRRVARYLRCGDSWTARWLLEQALQQPIRPPGAVLDLCGLVYQLQEMPERAAFFYQLVVESGGREAVSAANSIAMLYARHLPPSLRDLNRAEHHLAISRELIEQLADTVDTALDQALNANSRAYLKLLAGQASDALAISRAALQTLPRAAEGTQAHAVLANNLGRLLSRTDPGSAEIEPLLRLATEIEPRHPEFKLDLALALTGQNQFHEALSEATAANALTGVIAEIPALRAYLFGRLGQHRDAIDEYLHALMIDPQQLSHLVDACRSASAAEDYPRVIELASWVDVSEASSDVQAALAVLMLEARSFVEDLSIEQLRDELDALHRRYPDAADVTRSRMLVAEQMS
uniref:hypothetical protein n=1 Tax=Paractinoplanes polyasparticus TaxID=2856853 RepID=UPI001C86306C|nr:hypothetical protein [Actinoplanes polyasparticus]